MTDTSNKIQEQPERLSLSATQLLASALAAVSATVAASYFGVAGTVIGAGLGSVISVVGGAVYSYSIRRTRQRVRRGLDVAVAQRFAVSRPEDQLAAEQVAVGRPEPGRRLALTPRRLAVIAGALFVTTLAATTGFELASGQPLAATVHGDHGSGVSLGGGSTSKPSAMPSTPPSSSAPANSPSSTGSTSISGSPSATVTVTVTPSSSPSPPASASPSGSSSAAASPSGTPTG